MPRQNIPPADPSALRAWLIRQVYAGGIGHMNQTAFAVHLGMSKSRWNNFERGEPIGRDAENILIRKVPGLSLDFIRSGSRRGLDYEFARKLDALLAEIGMTEESVAE